MTPVQIEILVRDIYRVQGYAPSPLSVDRAETAAIHRGNEGAPIKTETEDK